MGQAQAWEWGGRPAERGNSGEPEASAASRAPPTLSPDPSVTGGPRVRGKFGSGEGRLDQAPSVLLPGLGLLGGSRSQGSPERDGMEIFST